MARPTDTVYPVRFTEEQRDRLNRLQVALSSPVVTPSLAEVIKFAVDELYNRTFDDEGTTVISGQE